MLLSFKSQSQKKISSSFTISPTYTLSMWCEDKPTTTNYILSIELNAETGEYDYSTLKVNDSLKAIVRLIKQSKEQMKDIDHMGDELVRLRKIIKQQSNLIKYQHETINNIAKILKTKPK